MHIAPDNILVSCSIALLLGSWSFLICYFLFTKARLLFYIFSVGLILVDLALVCAIVGILLMLISLIVAIIAAAAHAELERKSGDWLTFSLLHYVACQIPILFAAVFVFLIPNQTFDIYLEPLIGNLYTIVLLFIAPSLGLIPLYMFKTYRPRPGIDTHFPDAGNN